MPDTAERGQSSLTPNLALSLRLKVKGQKDVAIMKKTEKAGNSEPPFKAYHLGEQNYSERNTDDQIWRRHR